MQTEQSFSSRVDEIADAMLKQQKLKDIPIDKLITMELDKDGENIELDKVEALKTLAKSNSVKQQCRNAQAVAIVTKLGGGFLIFN